MKSRILISILALLLLASPVAAGSVGTVLLGGRINQANPSHGDDYLAIRAPRGTEVRVCGPAACHVMPSTDYGPVKGTGKIADLALRWWLVVCGKPASAGTCVGSIEYGGTLTVLPPTDVATQGGDQPVSVGVVLLGAVLGAFIATASILLLTRRGRR